MGKNILMHHAQFSLKPIYSDTIRMFLAAVE